MREAFDILKWSLMLVALFAAQVLAYVGTLVHH